jgi:hypothetical protein
MRVAVLSDLLASTAYAAAREDHRVAAYVWRARFGGTTTAAQRWFDRNQAGVMVLLRRGNEPP